ncbi:MAG: VOC family protein [Gammaproteobacteria bacterium]|jgi:predicted lactoylglutathione lyase|tara:strand:- start:36 stop:422 length:387 start_codon:yes stop_codon:yes gene_type:complete
MSVNLKGYSTIGTNNKEAAETFYDGVLEQLEAIKFPANDRITMWMSKDDGSVLLAIAVPYDGEKANHGNGTMKAIALSSQEEVVTMYNKAMEMGAKDDGEPGMRAGKFYGAYVYDLDGNKLCFFNFGD